MGSRIAALIERYDVRIEISPVFVRSSDYTLVYQGRSLKGKMQTTQTITCEEALFGEFVVAEQQDEPGLTRVAKRTEKKLRALLGEQYEEFRQALLADEAERMQGWYIEVKPDPDSELLDEQHHDADLKRLTSHDLHFGRRVVYFDSGWLPRVYVGRVEEVNQTSLGEMVTSGLVADVVLLQADDHEHMANLFYQTYLYGTPEPFEPGVYTWPGNLPPQTFRKPKRPGHLVAFQMTLPHPISLVITSSANFDHYPGENNGTL